LEGKAKKVTLSPEQMGLAEEKIMTLAVTMGFTVTTWDAQVVVLQVPDARTKYVVVLPGETVMEVPVPAAVPPQLPVNHCQFAPVPNDPPETVRVVLPPAQMVVVPVIPVGAVELVKGEEVTSSWKSPVCAVPVGLPTEIQ
jgi:hypothetical protein